MSDDTMLQTAIQALENGERKRARDLLTRLLRADQKNPDYWLWLSAAVDTRKEKVYCLSNVLRLSPEYKQAYRGLVLLGERPADPNNTPVRPKREQTWAAELPEEIAPTSGLGITRIALIAGGAIAVLALLVWGSIGVKKARQPVPTQVVTYRALITAGPSSTTLPTTTPVVRSPTPTFLGPTPLWMLLDATYTPTPLYVNTPHPLTEAYRSGLRALERQDWAQVVIFMQQVIQLEPGAADAYYYMAVAKSHQQAYDNALNAIKKSLEINPAFAPGYLEQARILVAQNSDANVQTLLDKAIEIDPNLVDAYVARAAWLISQGDDAAALEDLSAAQSLRAGDAQIYLYQAQAYLAQNDLGNALPAAEKAHQLDFTLLPAYQTLGQIYLADHQPQKSIGLLQTYLLYYAQDAQSWALLGQAYWMQNETDHALEALNRAIKINDRLASAYLYRGLTYLDLEQVSDALDDLTLAQKYTPKDFMANLALGRAMLSNGTAGSAYMQFNETQNFAQTDQDLAALYYWRALAQEAREEPASAALDWQALLDLPTDAVSAEWLAEAQNHILALTPTATPTPTRTPTPTPTRTPPP